MGVSIQLVSLASRELHNGQADIIGNKFPFNWFLQRVESRRNGSCGRRRSPRFPFNWFLQRVESTITTTVAAVLSNLFPFNWFLQRVESFLGLPLFLLFCCFHSIGFSSEQRVLSLARLRNQLEVSIQLVSLASRESDWWLLQAEKFLKFPFNWFLQRVESIAIRTSPPILRKALVSIQLVSLASREPLLTTCTQKCYALVSIQLVSLASRESNWNGSTDIQKVVSIQLVSLASRESSSQGAEEVIEWFPFNWFLQRVESRPTTSTSY